MRLRNFLGVVTEEHEAAARITVPSTPTDSPGNRPLRASPANTCEHSPDNPSPWVRNAHNVLFFTGASPSSQRNSTSEAHNASSRVDDVTPRTSPSSHTAGRPECSLVYIASNSLKSMSANAAQITRATEFSGVSASKSPNTNKLECL